MMENNSPASNSKAKLVQVPAGPLLLDGNLSIPEDARGMVLLAQGSRNLEDDSSFGDIAAALYDAELATLLVHLLIEEEETLDQETQFFRFNVDILHQRIMHMAEWLLENPETHNLSVGYFANGPTGGAALIAAAQRPDLVHAIVATNARTDLAQPYFARVLAPTYLIAGENDTLTVRMYTDALAELPAEVETNKKIELIAGATGLFETPFVIQKVAGLASQWFRRYLEPIV
jgi:putative phosphoribosyl transferase